MATLARPAGVDAEELYRKTAGNPFFVTEVLASADEEIPSTVRDAVLARAARMSADARALLDIAKQEGIFEKTIFLFGGPRVDHKTALELGFDAGFGPGTKPSDVANYIYYRMLERSGKLPPPQPTAHGTQDATVPLTADPKLGETL